MPYESWILLLYSKEKRASHVICIPSCIINIYIDVTKRELHMYVCMYIYCNVEFV